MNKEKWAHLWLHTLQHRVSRFVPGRTSFEHDDNQVHRRAHVGHGGRAVVDLVAPMGYENETGFCYGSEPVVNSRRSRCDAQN